METRGNSIDNSWDISYLWTLFGLLHVLMWSVKQLLRTLPEAKIRTEVSLEIIFFSTLSLSIFQYFCPWHEMMCFVFCRYPKIKSFESCLAYKLKLFSAILTLYILHSRIDISLVLLTKAELNGWSSSYIGRHLSVVINLSVTAHSIYT